MKDSPEIVINVGLTLHRALYCMGSFTPSYSEVGRIEGSWLHTADVILCERCDKRIKGFVTWKKEIGENVRTKLLFCIFLKGDDRMMIFFCEEYTCKIGDKELLM